VHQLPRLLDSVNVQADVVERGVLLLTLLLYRRLVAEMQATAVAPALRVVRGVSCCCRSCYARQRRPLAAAAAAAGTVLRLLLSQLAVPYGGPGRRPRQAVAACFVAACVARVAAAICRRRMLRCSSLLPLPGVAAAWTCGVQTRSTSCVW
jgi:hypothetical protein